jgi:hypothetical protein
MLWGSIGMIKESGVFQRLAAIRPHAGIYQLEEARFQMRKDLGYGRRGLEHKGLLRLFITDVDTVPYVSLRTVLQELQQICKRLNRRAAPKAAPDRAGSLPASPTFLRIAVDRHANQAHGMQSGQQ